MSNGDTKYILVTGGCGYIGTHTIVCLLEQNYSVVVVDNLINSNPISLEKVKEICNLPTDSDRVIFHKVDICHEPDLRKVFETSPKFEACIHFAGLKVSSIFIVIVVTFEPFPCVFLALTRCNTAFCMHHQAVGESTRIPLRYYENNLVGTFVLMKLMDEFNCHSLVFSSSATVYGSADQMPITEETTIGLGITNAYGRTKYMIEEVLRDFYHSQILAQTDETKTDWSITILRYFNPVGSHPSGKIGEDPNGIPNNLMPFVAQVAVGRREYLTVFGKDYPTPDGTGVRDYLHVMDLAEGHLSAIGYMREKQTGCFVFNLGTGNGYSVLDMVNAMTIACGHEIKYHLGDRRPGDIATCYADATKAKQEMGWEAKRGLDEMCADLWSWQQQNPNGFGSAVASEK